MAAKRNLVECSQCGSFNRLPPENHSGRQFCFRCDYRLHRQRANWVQHSLAYVLAGLVLFVVSNVHPFLSMKLADQTIETTLLSGVWALISRDEVLLGALVFLTIFLLPLAELLALSYMLLGRLRGRPLPASDFVMVALSRAQHWNMLEVFLLAVLVTTVKLSDMAEVVPGAGLYSFLAVVLLLSGASVMINQRDLWQLVNGNDYYVAGAARRLYGCTGCAALVDPLLNRCPRCHTRVSRRFPHSVQRTWGFLVAAMVLYIPANTLPMMFTTSLGATQSDTIFTGVVYLVQTGQWPIAMIVFIASILVPIGKIGALLYLLGQVRKPAALRRTNSARLYRLTELVGRWSMVDVYVVILMMALVQFGIIANVEPGGAALAFGCVVLLTMLAADSFDPRLLWDGVDKDGTS